MIRFRLRWVQFCVLQYQRICKWLWKQMGQQLVCRQKRQRVSVRRGCAYVRDLFMKVTTHVGWWPRPSNSSMVSHKWWGHDCLEFWSLAFKAGLLKLVVNVVRIDSRSTTSRAFLTSKTKIGPTLSPPLCKSRWGGSWLCRVGPPQLPHSPLCLRTALIKSEQRDVCDQLAERCWTPRLEIKLNSTQVEIFATRRYGSAIAVLLKSSVRPSVCPSVCPWLSELYDALCRKKDAETARLMHLLRRLKIHGNSGLYSRKKVCITVTATRLVKNPLQHSALVYAWAWNRYYIDVECIGLINSVMLAFIVADQLPQVATLMFGVSDHWQKSGYWHFDIAENNMRV